MDMIERNCMDMVIFFYNPLETSPNTADILSISRCCDQYNIPIATNIATAESLILGLARGDLDWRLNIRSNDMVEYRRNDQRLIYFREDPDAYQPF